MDNKFETEVLTRLAVIESKIDDYKQTERLANDAYQKGIFCEREINEMKESNKWLRRLVIGAIITTIASIASAIFLIIVEKGVGLK